MNILVVASHPDDEVLGCGGTIARLADGGHDVSILILGDGVTARYDDPADADPVELETLHAQAQSIGRGLGAIEVTLAKLPDNRFDSLPLIDIVKIIEAQVARVRPTVVYTQHGGDLNIDHATTFRATLTATRATPRTPVREVFAYEIRSSTEWAHQQFAPAYHPNTFVDVSATLEQKIAAMEAYEGEARTFPHPRSAEALRATARYWGSVAGLEAAEPFQLVRGIVS